MSNFSKMKDQNFSKFEAEKVSKESIINDSSKKNQNGTRTSFEDYANGSIFEKRISVDIRKLKNNQNRSSVLKSLIQEEVKRLSNMSL